MPQDKFYIGPYDRNSGLINAIQPFMVPDRAFSRLDNCYVWRDRVRKKYGTQWLGATQQSTRLRISVATTAAITGNLGSTTMPGIVWDIGQMFSVDNTLFTVYQANGATLTTGAATATFNTANGHLVITGNTENPLTTVYFYPATPVMGLITYQSTDINDELTIAFDTQFSYQWNGAWDRISAEATGGAATWTGSDSQFFWGYTYWATDPAQNVLYVTNFNQNEPNFMRYLFNNAGTLTWQNFRPIISQTGSGATYNIYLVSARILVPFHGRLVAFNTWEAYDTGAGSTLANYQNRARWNLNQSDPTGANNWREDLTNNTLASDATTQEPIITVEFIRDRLMVYFESSTWEFVYTGNEVDPFRWQQINTELGAESTFSIVPFDTVSLGIGNEGIVSCTGTNVERIDAAIPDTVFNINLNQDGPARVAGIRDFYTEMVWWTLPDSTRSATFPYPIKILAYNYKNQTWAEFDDSITTFGYFWQETGALWSSTIITWEDEFNWETGSIQSKFRQVIAGNQQGWTFILFPDQPFNDGSLQITNITVDGTGYGLVVTCENFNLFDHDAINLNGIVNTGNMATELNNTNQFVEVSLTNANQFNIILDPEKYPKITGVYEGGGYISRVDKIDILTKAYNFYQKSDRNAAINKIDFLVDATAFGEVLISWYLSNNITSMVKASAPVTGTGVLLGTSILETRPYATITFEEDADQLWHSIYISANGEYIQVQITMSDEQLLTPNITSSEFVLYAQVYTAIATSRLQ